MRTHTARLRRASQTMVDGTFRKGRLTNAHGALCGRSQLHEQRQLNKSTLSARIMHAHGTLGKHDQASTHPGHILHKQIRNAQCTPTRHVGTNKIVLLIEHAKGTHCARILRAFNRCLLQLDFLKRTLSERLENALCTPFSKVQKTKTRRHA